MWLPWAATAATGIVVSLGAWALWQFAPWADRSHDAVAAVPAPAKIVANAPDPQKIVAPAAAPTVALQTLLTQNNAETDPDNAFAKLFKLWGVEYVAGDTDPCTQAQRQGLDCLMQRGSFGQLRLYNRPAILMVNDDTGGTHQIVVTSLSDERARIALGGVQHEVGIGELSHYWFGDFVLLKRHGAAAKAETPVLIAPAVRGS
jgi:general secretion pathway protein A